LGWCGVVVVGSFGGGCGWLLVGGRVGGGVGLGVGGLEAPGGGGWRVDFSLRVACRAGLLYGCELS
jgi:hypothetical protein